MLKQSAILSVSALLAGGVIGWRSGGTESSATSPVTEAPAPRERPRPRWTQADFLEGTRGRVEAIRQPGYNPYAGVLADWTDAEIRTALQASLTHPDCVLPSGLAEGLPIFLLKEWMTRDFDAALAWFDGIQSGSVKHRIARSLSSKWPAEKSAQGLAYIRANRDLFPNTSCWAILARNIESAATKGPAAVNDLLQALREEKFDLGFENPLSFPAGFDFAALLEGGQFDGPGEQGLGSAVIRAWRGQDGDGAFDWLLAHRGAGSLAAIAVDPNGDSQVNLPWLGGKFETLDPQQRGEFLDGVLGSWVRSPQSMLAFAGGIQDPRIVDEIRSLGVQSVFAGHAHEAMALLESIPETARRIEVLENAQPAALFSSNPYLRGFDRTDEALLRTKLAEWSASEEQIETVISRFKP